MQSGREASLVEKIAQVEDNDTHVTIRDPLVITISKSAVYAANALTYVKVKLNSNALLVSENSVRF